jgi:hypothetical protein
MFGFRQSRRNDPDAIAAAVLRVGNNADLLTKCYHEFAPTPQHQPRALFSAILFTYCSALFWVITKNDARVIEAYDRAGEVVANRLKDADTVVLVGDYLISELELGLLPFTLETHFPEGAASYSTNVLASMEGSLKHYQIRLATLAKAVISMRSEDFAKQIGLLASDPVTALMTLAYSFDDYVTGTNMLNISNDPELRTQWQMRSVRGSVLLGEYFKRISEELDAL